MYMCSSIILDVSHDFDEINDVYVFYGAMNFYTVWWLIFVLQETEIVTFDILSVHVSTLAAAKLWYEGASVLV